MQTRNLVVGTAGHVDHGKTALVKALTGTDTDVLSEERRRGITIEPGYAFLDLPSHQTLDFVDVPGHEKLVRNMLRGITGVDIALLVVAADDGPMPQTVEHLAILDLLEVRTGLVVLTKTDIVDADLLELAESETREIVRKTCLRDAPIVRFSARTNVGRELIIEALEACAATASPRERDRPFRLPVDRTISVTGHGTVATGTVASGALCEGQKCQVYPGALVFKARRLQVHRQAAASVSAGDRAGVNLAGAELPEIARGSVLAEPGSLQPTHLVNARFHHLPGRRDPVSSRRRVRFFTGTTEVMGRIVLMERDGVAPGEDALVQFRLEEKVAPLVFDKYVVRSLSPAETIGGGIVLDVSPRKYRKYDAETIAELRVIETGNERDLMAVQSKRLGMKLATVSELSQLTGLTRTRAREVAKELATMGVLVSRGGGFVNSQCLEQLRSDVLYHMDLCYRDRPRWTVPKEELRRKVYPGLDPDLYNWVLQDLQSQGRLWVSQIAVGLVTEERHLNGRQHRLCQDMIRRFSAMGWQPLRPVQLYEILDRHKRSEIDEIMKFLKDQGRVVELPDGSWVDAQSFEKAEVMIAAIEESFSLANARDLLGVGRRATQNILEYLDLRGVTRRVGDERVSVTQGCA